MITGGELIVGKSKTDAGAGRVIPLTKRVCALLSLWLSRFPTAVQIPMSFPASRGLCSQCWLRPLRNRSHPSDGGMENRVATGWPVGGAGLPLARLKAHSRF